MLTFYSGLFCLVNVVVGMRPLHVVVLLLRDNFKIIVVVGGIGLWKKSMSYCAKDEKKAFTSGTSSSSSSSLSFSSSDSTSSNPADLNKS